MFKVILILSLAASGGGTKGYTARGVTTETFSADSYQEAHGQCERVAAIIKQQHIDFGRSKKYSITYTCEKLTLHI